VKSNEATMTEAQAFLHAGFTDFVHVDPKRRAGKKLDPGTAAGDCHRAPRGRRNRLAGRVDYVSPEATAPLRHFFPHRSLAEVVVFITNLPAEEGAGPQELACL
jgi:hypothetical protein